MHGDALQRLTQVEAEIGGPRVERVMAFQVLPLVEFHSRLLQVAARPLANQQDSVVGLRQIPIVHDRDGLGLVASQASKVTASC